MTSHRSSSVEFLTDIGQSLSCNSEGFILAIIESYADHLKERDGVMCMFRRVLRSCGCVYLSVNCSSSVGFWVHRLLSRLRLDFGHPRTFTPAKAQQLLQLSGSSARAKWADGSLWRSHQDDIGFWSSRARLRALLMVSEYQVAFIGVKQKVAEQGADARKRRADWLPPQIA